MIKEITKQDIPECVNVIRTSFLTVADALGFNSDNAPRSTAFATTEERLIWQLENEHRPMYGYYENDRIIGYYSLALQEDHECELNNLCVLPEYRHEHIGEKSVNDAYDRAKALDCIRFSPTVSHSPRLVQRLFLNVFAFLTVSGAGTCAFLSD